MGLARAGRTITEWGCGPDYQFWRYQTDVDRVSYRRFVITVACVLHCGLDWMLSVAKTSGFPRHKIGYLEENTRAFFTKGFKVPEFGDAPSWVGTEAGKRAVESVLRFSNWLVAWGHTLTVYEGSEIPKDYILPFLIPGSYEVTVESRGFRTSKRPSVFVRQSDRVTIDTSMEVGEAGQSVQVTAETNRRPGA